MSGIMVLDASGDCMSVKADHDFGVSARFATQVVLRPLTISGTDTLYLITSLNL